MHFYSGGLEENMSLHGKQRRAAENSHRPSGNALERGRDALAKLKKTGGQMRHAATRVG
jgi:hypothetical protein